MKAGHISKHCHLCGRRLQGNAWVYAPNGLQDEQSVVICRHCQETAPRCDVCGVPMGERHVRLPDGRRTCTRCHRTAVYDPAQARALFERVTHIVVDQLELKLNVGADFTLVDRQHLRRLMEESNLNVHGDAGQVVGLFVRKGRKRVMYLLSGLPQVLLIQTVAHEWAHAWQGENCPLLRAPLVREGFAEWVAYKTLQTMGAVKKMALMEQQDGLYGEGLRKMLDLERRVSATGVIASCRKWTS